LKKQEEKGFGSLNGQRSSQVPHGMYYTSPPTAAALSSVGYLSTAASEHRT
jgi:hypothetical protein